jgi:hypothetical protein
MGREIESGHGIGWKILYIKASLCQCLGSRLRQFVYLDFYLLGWPEELGKNAQSIAQTVYVPN